MSSSGSGARVELAPLLADVQAEADDLAGVVGGRPERDWDLATPAEGWTVRDQIAHLAYFDGATVTALSDPAAFAELRQRVFESPQSYQAEVDHLARRPGPELLAGWMAGRKAMVEAFGAADPAVRVPWFGPDMSVASKATARLMETWAHGQDVADALGVERRPTARLRHVAHIGVRAFPNSYRARGMEVPDVSVAVVLRGPAGERWEWGPPDAPDRVEGPALDFCLVVTQRRHVDDTRLVTTPGPARRWMEVAQAFAGPPGAGRRPGQFPPPRS
ncbi:MAG TPA: TIGR03084 family metal-binding protein [Acidimicrobiales bacterium]|nr:TIGR03084 family metal-binding protein [Acidimicrobiales bacterium]